ncbi:MAG TPA: hypothetical protein VG871_22140 [Vicinamibacterales bacterium]|nr:hypothetical protein [Vicinamibacterales bacterium]
MQVGGPRRPADQPTPGGPDTRTWVLWCATAVILFLPALRVGLLSTDYVLVDRARGLPAAWLDPQSFHPVPLLAWRAMLSLGAGPAVLHLLNIVLHGADAFLVYRLAAGFMPQLWAFAAGALMLTLPLAPEAVVWNSGIVQVSGTFFILATVVVARGYGEQTSRTRRGVFFALAALALMSNDTATLTAVLVGIDALARKAWPKTLRIDTAAVFVADAAFATWRLVRTPSAIHTLLTWTTMTRWVEETVGALVWPVHAEVARAAAWLPIAGGVALGALAVAFVLRRPSTETLLRVGAYAVFALVATLPVAAVLVIGPELQQSRFLYLSAAGYACVLALAARAVSTGPGVAWTRGAAAMLVVLIALHVVNLEWNVHRWVDAAALRDRILGQVAIQATERRCSSMAVLGLPDEYEGAPLFDAGVAQAFETVGVRVSNAPYAGECLFRWTQVQR